MNKTYNVKDKQDISAIISTCLDDGYVSASMLARRIVQAGYRKVPDGAVILTPEERDEELKACNEKQADLEAEIEKGKVDYYIKGVEDGRQDFELIKIQNFELLEEVKQLEADNGRFVLAVKEFDEFARDISKARIEITGEAIPTCKTLLEYIKKEKRNAVKEFAEMLKRKAFDKDMFNDWAGATYVVLVRDIDKILKEFTKCDTM